MRRAVFLDRDGVINAYFCDPEFGTIDSPASPEQFTLYDGVPEALQLLRQQDFLLLVVSNQPGIAKGRFTPKLLDATTEKMKHLCGGVLDGVYYCLHHPEALWPDYRQACECRKPSPGMLFQAAREWDIDLPASYMIGDGVVDVKAGKAAGVSTIFVGGHKCYMCHELEQRGATPDHFADNLRTAANLITILSNKRTQAQPHC